MKPWVDYLFALATMGLAVSAFFSPSLGRLGAMLAAVYIVVAASFAHRRAAERPLHARDVIAAFPGVAVGGIAVAAAGPVSDWPGPALILWVVGGAGMAMALTSMGDAFGVLPQHRRVVTQGAYSLVRHPMYLAQLVMIAGCAVAAGSWQGMLLLVGAFVLLAVRVEAEERALAVDSTWRAYVERVPCRWIPGVF